MIDKRGDVWTYPSGRIRLKGKALEDLRLKRFWRDNETCRKCGERVYFTARFDGDPQAYDMAHIVSRGAGGSDVIGNVETWCHRCHMRFHNTGK
jgi:5-methylcytosine-specific restriction endonuclease McrA